MATTSNTSDTNNNTGETEIARNQDEGVLHDVLEQLDRERTRRAEVEDQMRKLTEELESERAKPKLDQSPEAVISRRQFVAMETQVKGFQELVDALTLGKPAIAAAARAAAADGVTGDYSNGKCNKSLPLHVVRLLEVMPWDPRAQEHIFGREHIYEWQVFDERENKWQSNVRHFPALFKTLPIVRPKTNGGQIQEDKKEEDEGSTSAHNNNNERSLLLFLAGGGGENAASSPSKHGVLTNERITHVYNIEAGYPLPQDGGRWEWIGGWRVEKHAKPSDSPEMLLCDENGWSYALEAQNFLSTDNDATMNNGAVSDSWTRGAADALLEQQTTASTAGVPKRNVRRRKWTRRRMLVDYPLASERTQQYLKVMAENARLSITAGKISSQLIQIKVALTEAEEKLVLQQQELDKQKSMLRAIGVDPAKVDKATADAATDDDASNAIQEFLSKNEQVNQIGSKITQWVKSARKTSEDLTSCESADDEGTIKTHGTTDDTTTTTATTPQKFDWKKIGRGGLIEKLARPSPGSGRALGRRSDSSGSGTLVSSTIANIEEQPAVVEPVPEH